MFIDNLILSFFIYAIIGYICEVIYCSSFERRLVNRGFLFGPYIPIYGFGALIVVIFLLPLKKYPAVVFFCGLLLTSILEYFSSWLLEKLFSIKLWDYSRYRFHINGRVCLLNSTLFGIMGLCGVYIVDPRLSAFISSIPEIIRHYTAELILIIMSIDTTISVIRMNSFRKALAELRAKAKELEAKGTEIRSELKAKAEIEYADFRLKVKMEFRGILLNNPTLTAKKEETDALVLVLKEWAEERINLKKQYKESIKASNDKYREKRKEIKKNG